MKTNNKATRISGGARMMCDDCIYAGCVGGYPDGEDMFVCDCRDPRVPFDMEEGTVCPCYVKVNAEVRRTVGKE